MSALRLIPYFWAKHRRSKKNFARKKSAEAEKIFSGSAL
jgi:hypothetical protein